MKPAEHLNNIEAIVTCVIDCGLQIHRDVGPGLLETAYETVMVHRLTARGFSVERQRLVPVLIDGIRIDQGFRADLIVNDQVLIELKSVERLAPVHAKQVLTYLRFLDYRIGLLMNFGAPTFREGLQRIVNRYEQ